MTKKKKNYMETSPISISLNPFTTRSLEAAIKIVKDNGLEVYKKM